MKRLGLTLVELLVGTSVMLLHMAIATPMLSGSKTVNESDFMRGRCRAVDLCSEYAYEGRPLTEMIPGSVMNVVLKEF